MATTTFKPTINIKSSFTTIGAGFKKANKSVGSMRTILLKKTKVKKDAIAGRKSLFGKRIENQRRKEEEAVVEASKPTAIGRIGNKILDSGKSLFGRIMDFVGTLLIGWLVNNLPTIITMAQDLIGRIQKTVTILGNFMKGIGGIFTGSTKVFGAVLTNITSFDFFDSNKRLSTALGELESVFGDMNKQFDDGLKMLTTPLGQMPGETPVPPTGTDYTMPPGEEVNTKTLGSATDLKSGARAIMNAGFPAKGAAYLAGNIQQESGWRGQRSPWVLNDGAGTNKGLVSWNRGRITNAEKFLGKPLNKASNAEQIRWIKHEMKTYYPGAYKIFMNPNSTDADLQKASYIYLGYGDVGSRFAYARQALDGLQKGGSEAQVSQSTPLTPVTPVITGRYGESRKGNRSHGGTDLAAPSGTPLTAVSDGEIVDSDFEKGWGNFLVMKDNLGIYHLYGHMQSGYKRRGPVKKGEVIGKVGTTGRTTGPHLHWEAGTGWNGGTITGKFDPLKKYSKSAPFNGISGQGASPQVASVPSAAPSLPSTARAPQVMVMDDRPAPQPQQPQVASGGGSAPPMIDSENVLNNLMRNYLLLDLAYT
jgi:murein DD-endopeptidase MepM/ murein hydrolase activator NlpD